MPMVVRILDRLCMKTVNRKGIYEKRTEFLRKLLSGCVRNEWERYFEIVQKNKDEEEGLKMDEQVQKGKKTPT